MDSLSLLYGLRTIQCLKQLPRINFCACGWNVINDQSRSFKYSRAFFTNEGHIAVPNFLNVQFRVKLARTYSDLKAAQTSIGMCTVDWNFAPPFFLEPKDTRATYVFTLRMMRKRP